MKWKGIVYNHGFWRSQKPHWEGEADDAVEAAVRTAHAVGLSAGELIKVRVTGGMSLSQREFHVTTNSVQEHPIP